LEIDARQAAEIIAARNSVSSVTHDWTSTHSLRHGWTNLRTQETQPTTAWHEYWIIWSAEILKT